MEVYDLEDLESRESAPADLFLHRGQKILAAGQDLNEKIIQLLRKTGIQKLYGVLPDEQELFKFDAVNTPISTNSDALKKEGKLNQSLYDDRGRLILKEGETWTLALTQKLKKENIETVYLRRSEKKIKEDEEKATLLINLIEEITLEESPKTLTRLETVVEDIDDEYPTAPTEIFSTKGLEQLSLRLGNDVIPDKENALENELQERDPSVAHTDTEKEKMRSFQKNSVKRMKSVCESIIAGYDGNTQEVARMMKETLSAFIQDRHFLLLMNYLDSQNIDEDFIMRHNLNRAIYTIQIATKLGYSTQQVFELAFGSLLHDIGMMKVPKEILLKKGKLTEEEKMEIFKHPSHSLSMLQKLPGIPLTTPLIAYQCHERGDSTGYPQRRKLKVINKYSRIAMVADIYCALTNPRAHRRAYTPDQAMEYLSREASSGRIDPKVFQAFLEVNTFYPVGTWVMLSDGHLGRVIATTEGELYRPVIRTFFKDEEPLESFGTIDLAQETNVDVIKTFDGNKLNLDSLIGV